MTLSKTPVASEGQGSQACCSPWGCKESDSTKWLKNNIPKLEQENCNRVWPLEILKAVKIQLHKKLNFAKLCKYIVVKNDAVINTNFSSMKICNKIAVCGSNGNMEMKTWVQEEEGTM